ncbi:MAG TPA: TIGR02453 family protein, partial [Microbacterium sp.]|nr:TIGR02453 family protein [Microbacterium sp.]
RFSADKSPYKTNAAMVAGTIASIYLSVSAGGIEVGGGLYQPSRGQLRRGREAIEDDATGSTFERIADDIEAAGFTFAGPPLKTAPRGYDREHPRIVRLRLT